MATTLSQQTTLDTNMDINIDNNIDIQKKSRKLPDKYAKFLQFGFYFIQYLHSFDSSIDLDLYYQKLHLFSDISTQTSFILDFIKQNSQNKKIIRKLILHQNKNENTNKNTKNKNKNKNKNENQNNDTPTIKKGRKKIITTVLNTQDQLVADLVLLAISSDTPQHNDQQTSSHNDQQTSHNDHEQEPKLSVELPVENSNDLDTVNKNDVKEFLVNYFEKTCTNYKIDINQRTAPQTGDCSVELPIENTITVYWNKNLDLPFRYTDFYDEMKSKRIAKKWLNLPIKKSKYILKGLLDTHGCNNAQEWLFSNTSLPLINGIRYLCLRMGVLTSGYKMDETHETTTMVKYFLRIPKTREICILMNDAYDETQIFDFLRSGKNILTKVKSIKKLEYSGRVYDLQMEEEHNYLLETGIIHNGGGKRNGSFAIYLEPWHADIEMFLQMRKNHGDEELKARELFYALWIPDLFMERVKQGGDWTLVCPDECPGLADVWGDKFVSLYTKYESEGRGRKTMKARELWFQILDSIMETGTPYLLYKDACNAKSNQQNVGTIKSSNLCTEIIEYSSADETAVCNLASLALPSFVVQNNENLEYDFDKLHEVTKVVTRNLNRIIDINYYPTTKTRVSNMRHRPIGIGVQGLADVFMMLKMPFGSEASKQLNKDIFETIYHAAVEMSCDLAECNGAYETFAGSPASQGKLQFDLWGVEPRTDRYDWTALKERVQKVGLRNSLLVAPMPTASTSQILGFNECIEPITSNLYSRSTSAGSFVVANKYMMRDLIRLGLWNEETKNNIIANNGSIQQFEMIPFEIKELYKTVWEIPTKTIIEMAAERGVYVCQSQSLNIWVENPDYKKLTNIHFYSHTLGLKTACYYLRRKAAAKVQQFTIEPEKKTQQSTVTSILQDEDEPCEMCSA